jgi:hypothetical protein
MVTYIFMYMSVYGNSSAVAEVHIVISIYVHICVCVCLYTHIHKHILRILSVLCLHKYKHVF